MKLLPSSRRVLAALGLLCLASAQPHAATLPNTHKGLVFKASRIVYPENAAKGASLTIFNKSDNNWLVQSFIRGVDPDSGNVDIDNKGNATFPFIVTPPLERLDARSELTLRIRRNGAPLPDDKESVFYLSMKAIPAQSKAAPETNSTIALAVVSSMKLFYRPAGLKQYAIEDMSGQLRFRKTPTQLIAENPTPYWLTFAALSVGEQSFERTDLRLMVPPKGSRSYPLKKTPTGAIEWQLVDEDGASTPVKRQD